MTSSRYGDSARWARLRMPWWASRCVVFLVAGTLLVLGGHPSAALAHAVLVRSDPPQNARLTASPQRIDLFFSEPANHSFSTIQVFDSSGARHDKRDVRFTDDPTEVTVSIEPLGPGFYYVNWVTVSDVDAHRWQGTFPFTVLNADGTAPAGIARPPTEGGGSSALQPPDAVLRWLLYFGLFGITGGFGFAALILFPAAGALAGSDRLKARQFTLWLLGAVVPAALILVAIINAAVLLRQAEQIGSLGALRDLLSGRTGTYWLAREALALIAGGLVWWVTRTARRANDRLTAALLWAGLVTGLGGLLTMSLTSHAAAGIGSDWSVLSDFLHLTGVAFWLGCLVQLPAVLSMGPGLSNPIRRRLQSSALRRFSILAACSVAIVLLSGTFNALVQIASPAALKDTAYGRTLLVKLAFVLPLLGIGLLNSVRIAARFERLSHRNDDQTEQQGRRLARVIVLESIAGAIVVAAAAVLVFLVPARNPVASANGRQPAAAAASSVYSRETSAGDLRISLGVNPNRIGDNEFRVQLASPGVDVAQRVQLRFQSAKEQTGGSTVTLDPVAGSPGLFAASAANLGVGGRWEIRVNVRRAQHDDVEGAFRVTVPGSSGAAAIDATAYPAHGITPAQGAAAVLLATAVLLAVLRWRFGFPALPPRTVALAASTTALVAVAVFVVSLPSSGSRTGAGGELQAAAGPVASPSTGPGAAAAGRTGRPVTTTVAPVRSADYSSWKVPTSGSGLMIPAIGSDGRIWIGEMTANKLAVLDPSTNTYTEMAYPPGRSIGSMGVVVDAANVVWLAQSGVSALGRFDAVTGDYREIPIPTPNSNPSGIALDSHGRVWFTELAMHKVGVYDPAARTFAEYPVPDAKFLPYWLHIAPDGRVWFTDIASASIGVLDPASGRIDITSVPGTKRTTGIDVAADGTVWFGANAEGGKLGRLDPHNGQVSLLALPGGDAYGVTLDANGVIWVGTTGNTVYAFDSTTQQFRTFRTAAGPWWPAPAGDGSVWIAEAADDGNALVRISSVAASAGTSTVVGTQP